MTVKGKNLDDGNWDSIMLVPKGQNISKSTENIIWPWGSYGGVANTVVTATLSTDSCNMPGKYDLYLAKEETKGEGNYVYKAIAKKRNALIVKKSKNEAKIRKVRPKKIAKGGMAKVTISGKNFKQTGVNGLSIWIRKQFKKKGELQHETTAYGSVVTYTNSKAIVDVTVFTDSMKGKSDLMLSSYGDNSGVCTDKKNAIVIGKNKLKIKNVSPSQVANTGSADITISGKNLKRARSVKLINSNNSFIYLEASKIKTNTKKKIVATFPVTTTTTLGNYNLEVRGPDGRDFVFNPVLIMETIK